MSRPHTLANKSCREAALSADKLAEVSFRIRSKMLLGHSGGCWEWPGFLFHGYGVVGIRRDGQSMPHLVHRVMYAAEVGQIPLGLLVLHKCDNPKCCNPEHLFLGTHKDNTQDCIAKGRFVITPHKGEKNGNSKLTDDQVLKIRALVSDGIAYCKIARTFSVSRQHVRRIALGHNRVLASA